MLIAQQVPGFAVLLITEAGALGADADPMSSAEGAGRNQVPEVVRDYVERVEVDLGGQIGRVVTAVGAKAVNRLALVAPG